MTRESTTMTPDQLIAHLNSMTFGDLVALQAKLDEARRACLGMSQQQLADWLNEAGNALTVGDTRTYRKRLETVVAKLGHLK